MRVERVWFPPARLAAYMAVSAALTRSSMSSTLGGVETRAQRGAGDADAGRNGVAGGGDGFAQLFGDVVQVVGAVDVGDDEFFTAEASDHRCRRADQAKSTGHRDQGLVSGGMTVSVVEALEVIQIDHCRAQITWPFPAAQQQPVRRVIKGPADQQTR